MQKEFVHNKGDTYLVTGKTVDGKKFSMRISNPMHALAINLWRGRVWQVREGKRKLVKSVFN